MPSNSAADGDRCGCLYVVATPIGNAADLSPRAAEVLAAVDCVAAEDTRNTGRLMADLGARIPLVSYHEHNETQRAGMLISRMQSGERIALVSDAGTPTVSDPGYRLVRAAAEAGIRVVPVPGPSAILAALSVSGLPTDRFSFEGFVPKKAGVRRRLIQRLAQRPETLIFYESPRRVVDLVHEMIDILGDREAMIAREMTKPYEEFIRGHLGEIAAELSARPTIRGEITIIVAGAGKPSPADPERVEAAIAELLATSDVSVAAAAKEIARTFDMPRKSAYDAVMNVRKRSKASD